MYHLVLYNVTRRLVQTPFWRLQLISGQSQWKPWMVSSSPWFLLLTPPSLLLTLLDLKTYESVCTSALFPEPPEAIFSQVSPQLGSSFRENHISSSLHLSSWNCCWVGCHRQVPQLKIWPYCATGSRLSCSSRQVGPGDLNHYVKIRNM